MDDGCGDGHTFTDPSTHLSVRRSEMSVTHTTSDHAAQAPSVGVVDTKLEVVVLPVADAERAKGFYGRLGWRLDADFSAGEDWRALQMTPPGSPCSIIFGKGVTTAVPG